MRARRRHKASARHRARRWIPSTRRERCDGLGGWWLATLTTRECGLRWGGFQCGGSGYSAAAAASTCRSSVMHVYVKAQYLQYPYSFLFFPFFIIFFRDIFFFFLLERSRRTSADPASCCVRVVRGGVRSAPVLARVLRLPPLSPPHCDAPSPFFAPPSPPALLRLRRRVLLFVCGHAMASSPSQRDATRAPPPPDQLASFHSLVDKWVNAGVLCRHARDAELSAKAAEKGKALFGDDSLAVAHLQMGESMVLNHLAMSASGAEQQALYRRSWSALLSVIAILQCRLEANTLLPGTVRKEETDFYEHQLTATAAAKEIRVPPLSALQDLISTIGYDVLLNALYRSTYFWNFIRFGQTHNGRLWSRLCVLFFPIFHSCH